MLRIRTVCLAYIIFVQITTSSRHGHFLLAKFWCKLSSCVFNKSFVMFPTFMILWRGGGGGGGMGDFRNKYPVNWFERKKNLARKYLGEKYPALKKKISLMVYSAEKKSYNVISWGKNFISRGLGKNNSYISQITHTSSPPQKKSNSWPIKLSL